MNRIYCAIGKIMELSQQIEYATLDVCELSEIVKEFSRHIKMTESDYTQAKEDADYLKQKMATMTFGQLVGVMRESKSLAYDEITELKGLLEKRNYFAHEYFKYSDFTNASEDFILEEFTALKELIAKLKKMKNRLEIIEDGLKSKLAYLKNKNCLN